MSVHSPQEAHTQPGAALEIAKATKSAASQALTAAVKAHTQAKLAVDAHHNPIVERLRGELRTAHAAVLAATSDLTPDHEWEGRKVWCNQRKHRGWSGSETTRLEGVVFTYRPGVDLGQGHKYSCPEVGEPFVRLLKKDGNPGSKSVALRKEDWRLLDEATPAAPDSLAGDDANGGVNP